MSTPQRRKGKQVGGFQPELQIFLPPLLKEQVPLIPVAALAAAKAQSAVPPTAARLSVATEQLSEKHILIGHGDTGYTYENLFGAYLVGAKEITVEDPFIRRTRQINNFLRFCELVVKVQSAQVINLVTGFDDSKQKAEAEEKLRKTASSLVDHGIKLNLKFDENLHDREIQLDNGWTIKIGRGFDFYQKPKNWCEVGTNDLSLCPCRMTKVDIFRD